MFANHLPRVGVFNGKNDSSGCVRGEREEYATILFAVNGLLTLMMSISVGHGLGPLTTQIFLIHPALLKWAFQKKLCRIY